MIYLMKLRIISNFKKRWKWLVLLAIVAIAIGYWGYQKTHPQKEELSFIHPERGALVKTIEVPGTVTAKEYARMRFAAGGKITKLGFKEGDWVKKGQTIATIDQRSLQKNLEKSLLSYSKERLDWDQTLDNTKDRTLDTEENRSKQKSQLDLTDTVLDVELSDIAITNSVLSAPFDGVLISTPTNVVGVNLLTTDIFELINPSTLYFQAQIDELDIGQIATSQEAKIDLDAFPDETFPSYVKSISFKSEQTSTSTVFLIELPLTANDLSKFRLGLNGDATITLQTKENVLSIPVETTINRDDKIFVKVKSGENETTEKEIQTGMETEERIEVVSGLTENDEIVLPK